MSEDLERQKLEVGMAAGLTVEQCSRLRGSNTAELMADVSTMRELGLTGEPRQVSSGPSRPLPVESLGHVVVGLPRRRSPEEQMIDLITQSVAGEWYLGEP